MPSAAWIDEEGTIVRSNEGAYPAELTIGFRSHDSWRNITVVAKFLKGDECREWKRSH